MQMILFCSFCSSQDMQSLVDKVNETGKPYSMEMNLQRRW